MWEVSIFVLGIIVGVITVHSFANFFYGEKIRIVHEVIADLNAVYAAIKNVK